MTPSTRQNTRWRIALFIVLVLTIAGISSIFAGGGAGAGLIAWGLSPCLVAVLLRAVAHDWSDTGMRPALRTNRAWYAISGGAYPLIMGITLAVGVGLSVASVAGFGLGRYLQIVLPALAVFLVFAFFEEYGWRGYLVPKLAAIGVNDYLADGIVAVVWAAWHVPFLRSLPWIVVSEDLSTFLPRFLLGVAGFSFAANEIRRITGSIWPVVLLHGSSNAFGHVMVANYLTIAPDHMYLGSIGSDGLIMGGGFALLGLLVRHWRQRTPRLQRMASLE
jgi:uncharacterized protein